MIEQHLIETLTDLKYTYRPDICDRATLEQNFRAKFEALNRVRNCIPRTAALNPQKSEYSFNIPKLLPLKLSPE